jgi:hypothetical protein
VDLLPLTPSVPFGPSGPSKPINFTLISKFLKFLHGKPTLKKITSNTEKMLKFVYPMQKKFSYSFEKMTIFPFYILRMLYGDFFNVDKPEDFHEKKLIKLKILKYLLIL